jgi:hypothetical protein
MGTNYYRIPSQEEMLERKELLIQRAQNLDINSSNIACEFRNIKKMDRDWDAFNMWDDFTKDMLVHIGKRSSGWKFLWNFNKKAYYGDREELFQFLRRGRVVNEYYEEIDVEEFITMALEWGQPDGYDLNAYYKKHPRQYHYDYIEKESYIDGLRVSPSTDFS